MEWIHGLLLFLIKYTKTIALVGGFINEEFLVLLALFAGEGLIPLWKVCLFGFIGVILHDSTIYFLVRSPWMNVFQKKWKLSKKHQHLVSFIEKLGGKTYFFPLFLAKFIYGTRIALIWFVSKRKNFQTFFLTNAIAVALWFIIMMPIGWLAGQGFSQFLQIAKGAERIVTIILVALIIFYIVNRTITSALVKRQRSIVS